MDGFTGLALRGKNEWWRYVASTLLIALFWVVVGSFPLLIVLAMNGGPPFPWDGESAVEGPLSRYDPFITFYLPVSFSFISLGIGIVLTIRHIHKRPLISLVNGDGRIDWVRLRKGFAIFLAFNIVSTIISYALMPSNFAFTLDPWRLLAFAPFYIILTIVQTTSEELLFRGYLLQGLGMLLKRPVFAAVLSSLVFMAVHAGNPEVVSDFVPAMLYYLAVGLWLSLITLRDGRSEMAIGAHAANNLFILLLNYESSALEVVPSVFKMTQVGTMDMWLSLGFFVIAGTAAYALMFRRKARAG